MTIIRTKPSAEKKNDKLVLPLFEEGNVPTAPSGDESPLDPHLPHIYSARRVPWVTSLCLLLLALSVVGLGALGGMYLHRQYLRSQIFRGLVGVPLSVDQAQQQTQQLDEDNVFGGWAVDSDDDNSDVLKDMMHMMRNAARQAINSEEGNGDKVGDQEEFNHLMKDFFQEEIEVDRAGQRESITIPDFGSGRSGRFVHDFNTNHTGVIDITGQRCFVMPLNRTTVLPPQNLYDLVHKMWDGYYGVDTRVLREEWIVVTPPIPAQNITDEVGAYIAMECAGKPVYRLERYVGGVVKRSAELKQDVKFAAFSGKRIVELDIVNYADVEAFENAQH